jgi:serine phosphatase RsbU (regulator of sigma subunit)/PAS domain-containing protein
MNDGFPAVQNTSENLRDFFDADLRRVMTSARAVIWHATVQDVGEEFSWDIRMTNEDAAARLWPVALAPEEAYTLGWYRARLPEDARQADINASRALRSGATLYEQEFRVHLADGQYRWIGEDVRIEPLPDGQWHLVGVCMDITDRRREQETLRDVMTAARCLVWQATVRKGEQELNWEFGVMNEAAAERLWPVPVRPDQTYSAAWARSPLLEEQPGMDAVCREALESSQAHYHQEYRVRLAEGGIRWISEDVQIEPLSQNCWRLVGVCTDVTERKQAESALDIQHDKDRRIAETWQRSMLHEVPADTFPGLKIKTFYEAALQESLVGGDFFDALALDSARVALIVGDVSGKGLAAAAYTAEIKYALRAFLFAYPDPGEALSHLNDLLCGHQRQQQDEAPLAVLTLVVIDRITGQARITSAGAEPPQILRVSGQVEQCDGGGVILGVGPGAAYPVREVSLNLGDTLLMATDGITEARRGKEFFGQEGIGRLAQSVGVDAALEIMGHAIIQGARDYHGSTLGDDVCLLLARRG